MHSNRPPPQPTDEEIHDGRASSEEYLLPEPVCNMAKIA
jgi:hypothetical protein